MYLSLLLILISSLLFCFLLVVAVLCPFVISLPPVLTLSPLLLYFLLFLLSSSHVIFSGTPPPDSALPSLLSLSLSLFSSVSPEATLSHHSASFINTCTHAAQHTQLPHICPLFTHTCTCTHLPTAQKSPRMRGAQCVHTLTPAYCAGKCPL